MNFEVNGSESGEQLVKQLVGLRYLARTLYRRGDVFRSTRATWKEVLDKAEDGSAPKIQAQRGIAQCDESLMEIRFNEIGIGNYLMTLGRHLDAKADREQVLDALNVGLAARRSEETKAPVSDTVALIFVHGLEDSAERFHEDWGFGPLAWCCQMAFMNKMRTDEKFDRSAHDCINELFDGAFGEYRRRPLLERLAGRAV